MGWLVIVYDPIDLDLCFDRCQRRGNEVVRFRVAGYQLPWVRAAIAAGDGIDLTRDKSFGGYPAAYRLRARWIHAEVGKLSRVQSYEVDWTGLQNRDPGEWLTVEAWDES